MKKPYRITKILREGLLGQADFLMMYQHMLEGEGTKVAIWAVRVSPPWLYSCYSSWPNFHWCFLFLFNGWESWTDYDTDCNNCIMDTEGICKNNQMGPLRKVQNWDFYCKVPFSRYHSLLNALNSLSCFFLAVLSEVCTFVFLQNLCTKWTCYLVSAVILSK